MTATDLDRHAGPSAQTDWGAKLWVSQFLIALYSVIAATAIFGVPLSSVVDVVFPLQLLAPILPAAALVLSCAVIDGFAESNGLFLKLLGYFLTPFVASATYTGYAYATGDDLVAQSQIFGEFQHLIGYYLDAGARVGMNYFLPHLTVAAPEGLSNTVQFMLAGTGLFTSVMILARRGGSGIAAEEVHRLKIGDGI